MAPAAGLFTRSDPRGRGRISSSTCSRRSTVRRPRIRSRVTASVCNLQPESRGFVRCARLDPRGQARHQAGYLSTDGDRRVAADSIRVARNIVRQPAFAKYRPVEFLPGPAVGNDDAALIKAAGDIGTTIFHPIGTAKMGRATDPMAVVDERLRVIGLDRLRVVDASVMPTITSGNTNAPTMMIAEKGAAMIR